MVGSPSLKAKSSFELETTPTNSCCCRVEDCESSVTMRIRCRRVHLLATIPLLIAASILLNVTLIRRHYNNVGELANDLQTGGLSGRGGPSPTDADGSSSISQNKRRQARRRKSNSDTVKTRGQRLGEIVKPRAESLQPNATFSACLLIKDDNEILNEWLAYHYYELNLRHLIVAVDPLSTQSPSDILQRWRLMTNLEILEWNDSNYMPDYFINMGRPPETYMQKAEDFSTTLTEAALIEISNHRYRQRVFLAECMKKHRKLGNSWVIHIDTDEYVVASKLLRQMKPDYLDILPMDQPGSVLKLIQQAVSKTPALVSYPCISMLRVLFGSVESTPKERNKLVPSNFNSTRFETLRWRYHALPHNMTLHGNPKVILDVAAIPEKYFPDVVFSIHRPVPAFCHRNSDLTFTNFRRQPLAVNHYLGSWERYSARQDKRRGRAVYDAKANQQRGKDDGLRPWLQGFVREMGEVRAAKLLGKEYLASNTTDDQSQSEYVVERQVSGLVEVPPPRLSQAYKLVEKKATDDDFFDDDDVERANAAEKEPRVEHNVFLNENGDEAAQEER